MNSQANLPEPVAKQNFIGKSLFYIICERIMLVTRGNPCELIAITHVTILEL